MATGTVITTKTAQRTLQEVLDEASPDEVADALRFVHLGTVLAPLKRTFTGLTGTAIDLTANDATGETSGPSNLNRLPVAAVRSLFVTSGSAAVKASLDLSTKTTHENSVIQALVAGAGGNAFTIAFVQSAGVSPTTGTLAKVGSAYTFTFKDGVTTVANFEALVTASADLAVKTAGTGATVLHTTVDEFGAAHLAGGVDAIGGPCAVTDAGGTAIDPDTNLLGLALLSDDGKTLTFNSAPTAIVVEYIPRTLSTTEWAAAFASVPPYNSFRQDEYAPQFTGSDPDAGFL